MFEKHRKLCDDSNYIQLNDINTQKGIGKKRLILENSIFTGYYQAM